MTRKADQRHKALAMPPAAEKDYDVGYGKPPVAARFKKGKSGNPKGRPKRARRTIDLLQEELESLVTVHDRGQELKMSKRDAFIKSLVARAIKGDARAASQLLKAIETSETSALGNNTQFPGWPQSETSSGSLFPMSEEEWLAKYGPDATHPKAPGDVERLSDDQLNRALEVLHAKAGLMLVKAKD